MSEANPSMAGQPLTKREAEVLLFVGKGLSNKEVAELVGVSQFTVADYIKRIFAKLGVGTRVEAAVWACKKGML